MSKTRHQSPPLQRHVQDVHLRTAAAAYEQGWKKLVNLMCFNDPPPHNNSCLICAQQTINLEARSFIFSPTHCLHTSSDHNINATFGWSSCSFSAFVRSTVGKFSEAIEVDINNNQQRSLSCWLPLWTCHLSAPTITLLCVIITPQKQWSLLVNINRID